MQTKVNQRIINLETCWRNLAVRLKSTWTCRCFTMTGEIEIKKQEAETPWHFLRIRRPQRRKDEGKKEYISITKVPYVKANVRVYIRKRKGNYCSIFTVSCQQCRGVASLIVFYSCFPSKFASWARLQRSNKLTLSSE